MVLRTNNPASDLGKCLGNVVSHMEFYAPQTKSLDGGTNKVTCNYGLLIMLATLGLDLVANVSFPSLVRSSTHIVDIRHIIL